MSEQVFTIVVADDEEELLEDVCEMIDWESIGFRLVGRANNGLDALQLVEQLEPDLLLTDIQMPFIKGTELARQVRELQPLIQIAFLTGYDDFEYARSAIESQVMSYLLKPISMGELTQALKEIHQKMENRFKELMPSDGPASRHLTVASLLLDRNADFSDESEIIKRLYDAGLEFYVPFSLAVLALSAGSLPPTADQTVDKVLRQYFTCCSIISGGRVLSLLISENGFKDLGKALDELYYVCKRILGTDCTIGVSRRFGEFSGAVTACKEAVDALRLADGPGLYNIDKISSFSEERENTNRSAAELDRMLFTGNRRELEAYLEEELSPGTRALGIMQTMVTAQDAILAALGKEELSMLLRRCSLTDPLRDKLDSESFRRRVIEFCLAGNERISKRKQDGMSVLVERTLQIIKTRYMDESLSLNSVSEELHVSPNYLSANMKKYAGDTFINLLIKKRMETARTLIMAGGMKIGEVSEKCGYSDQHYFSFCFKKYYGVSPVKMRKGEENRN